ncbi:MAG: N-acetylmuramoyl-L-alanine amidase [Puniceicoccales bacterium]|jgi:N-acetylmuramoyl-L-alanine amidase|nr:N-acetylmuramoyl-L-alanine amidase [Puniceicoccales bacterium]
MRKLLIWVLLLAGIVSDRGICCAELLPLNKIASQNGLKMLSANSFAGANGLVFSFTEKSRTFVCNKILMPLGFPAVKRYFKVCIDSSDYKCHISPLLFPARQHWKKVKVIALDAGHGGEDDGTISPSHNLKEKILTMDVCVRVAKFLEHNGYRVVFVRQGDKKIPLERRPQIANSEGADLFVCIHFNSAPNQNANGIETFILTPSNQASTYQKSSKTSGRDLIGNDFNELNVILGYCLQSSLIEKLGATDRGVKHERFTVLKTLKCPGALIECGFLSNAPESAKITSAAYRNKLAEGIARGIERFDNLVGK